MIVVEEDEIDGQLLPDYNRKLLGSIDRVYLTVPMKGVEEAVVPVLETVTVPVEEDTPAPAELVIVDLDAAKEVEPHAAELEVAPEPVETTVVLTAARCVFIRD